MWAVCTSNVVCELLDCVPLFHIQVTIAVLCRGFYIQPHTYYGKIDMFAPLCLLFCPVIACIVELESGFVPTNFLDEYVKFVYSRMCNVQS